MKKAIVSGSTGFIGASFVEYLIQTELENGRAGRKRTSIRLEKTKLKGANYLKLDMSRIGALEQEIQGSKWDVGEDCIFFNLAWAGSTVYRTWISKQNAKRCLVDIRP